MTTTQQPLRVFHFVPVCGAILLLIAAAFSAAASISAIAQLGAREAQQEWDMLLGSTADEHILAIEEAKQIRQKHRQ